MRLETLMDLQGAQVVLYGDFSATVEIYKRVRPSGAELETWIGTWTDPNGVHVDLFDNQITLKRAVEEAIVQIMHLWQGHVVEKGTEEDLNTLIKFDQGVTRVLGLNDHAVALLLRRITDRVTQAQTSPFENVRPC